MDSQDSNIKALVDLLTNDPNTLKAFHLFENYQKKDNASSQILKGLHHFSEDSPCAIGPWQPHHTSNGVVFTREDGDESWYWELTRQTLQTDKSMRTKRVCFIGESAAHGMFFSPHYSPAKALEAQIKSESDDEWDIVDLTRICMNAETLIHTTRACLQLKPDFVVLFAGNNWFSDVMFEQPGYDKEKKARYLKKLGEAPHLSKLRQCYREDFLTLTDQVVGELHKIAADSAAKFIFLLPAVNHGSWERRTPPAWLDSGQEQVWFERYQSASQAIAEGRYEDALSHALNMIACDGGEYPTSNGLAAKCLLALKRDDEAYPYCVKAADYCNLTDQVTSFPGFPSFAKDKIMALSDDLAYDVIDLEETLSTFTQNKVLGEEVFVDYCHLNPKGFHVAMSPVSAWILNQESDKPQHDWRTMLVNGLSNMAIDPMRLGVSYFYLALYYAHLNQPADDQMSVEAIVPYLQKAVDVSPKMLDAMAYYLNARSCHFGEGFGLSESGHQLLDLTDSHLDLKVSQCAQGTDATTVEALCQCLEQNGRDGQQHLRDYQQPYIERLNRTGVDLSEQCYIERIHGVVRISEDHELYSSRKMPFYKSWWPQSHFCLVTDATSDLSCTLVSRVPGLTDQAEGTITILVNNQPIQTLTVQGTWTKLHFTLDGAAGLREGFNRVSITWPSLVQNSADAKQRFIDRYIQNFPVDVSPIHGEVFTFHVQIKD